MKNKGLVLFFTILIAAICVYCLSFTFVTNSVEKDAKKYAEESVTSTEAEQFLAITAKGEPMLKKQLTDSIYDWNESHYLSLMKDSSVFFGMTYKQCKNKELNLGLDLKGGMNVTLEISVPDVVNSLANNTEDELFQNAMNKAIVKYNSVVGGDFIDIFVQTFNEEKNALNLSNAALRTYFGDRSGIKNATDDQIKSFIVTETDDIVDRTFKILRTRIDRFGVAQPNIQRLAGGRILVELPGIKEPERVTDLLKSTAKLEFWEVYSDVVNGVTIHELFRQADVKLGQQLVAEISTETAIDTTTDTLAAEIDEDEDEEINNDLGTILSRSTGSDGVAIGFFKEADMKIVDQHLAEIQRLIGNSNIVFCWGKMDKRFNNTYPLVPLKKNNDRIGPKLSSETIDGARVVRTARQDVDQNNTVTVSMSMEDRASDEWRKITKAAADLLPGKQTYIAIVLDNIVYSYPVIKSEIPNGQSSISGSFSIEEAKDLATVLNSGNLEAKVNIVQSEVVGPTLGSESIQSGLISVVLAFILVLFYMIAYYSRAGLVADLALLTNLFFIMGVLSSLGAVLTLPGIAGIVLTLGMAVDANVIIYERIREEVRAGKGLRLAIEEGFKNAYSAIIDGNVTTLITAVVLYIFGSGPIQGFATSLIIGIISSLFTAIFISRLIFESTLKRKGTFLRFGNKYTINAFTNLNYDFLGMKKIFYSISAVLMLISIISFFTLKLQPGIDFTGGRNFVVRFDQPINTANVRAAVADEFGGNPEVKTFGGDDQVRITTNYKIDSNDPSDDKECEVKLYNALKSFYVKTNISQIDFTQQIDPRGIQSSQKVQPTIAGELLWSAIWAVLISLVLIFIYIAIRFKNWQFGLGGVFALFHDTLLTVGLFSLLYKIMPFSMEIDQSFIAAILTVIGYSINNVVIIYDRIRENLSLYPKRENYLNFNNAVNSTLGRTVNTCGTTVIVLLAMFIFGGEVIRGFVFAMGAGILIGTYSGIFISAPFAYDLISRKKGGVTRVKNELK
ncbi:MAG: protein translocase subunit SecDF [Bacteroidales bacterium]|jgi:SecD/SecF fusion protein|nr:protein translocase subunit SecDF [Bacteroidales bacterium]